MAKQADTTNPTAKRKCGIDGCDKKPGYRPWCQKHFRRFQLYGDPLGKSRPRADVGEPQKWLADHVNYDGEGCLVWPFARAPNGYAYAVFEGKARVATRVMCERVHGAPPAPEMEAAHSCGNGDKGCIHPRHIQWKTRKENAADKLTHGTVVCGERHHASRLTEEQVREIRSSSTKAKDLATRFGVSTNVINQIQLRKTWKHVA